jgi:hypothetical protein
MPETASEHVNETVTLVLFQPEAFGAGLATAVMIGSDVSRLAVTVATEVFPA